MRRTLILVFSLTLFFPLFAQDEETDIEGSKDHPMLSTP